LQLHRASLGGFLHAEQKQAKRQAFRTIFLGYDVVNLQEVMSPDEPEHLAPAGYSATVSAAKGSSSYREYYALLTRDGVVTVLDRADYPDEAGIFARPPFGVAVEDGKGRYWLVDIHTVFGKGGPAPRRQEVTAMAEVTRWYAERPLPDGSRVERVVVAGDWNLPTTDEAFGELAQANWLAAPNVTSSISARGIFASAYDHFLWNRAHMTIHFAEEPRDIGEQALAAYRETVSDHAGVAGYVLSSPDGVKPAEISCPPARNRGPMS
jgi:hypothetical protein